MKGGQLLTLAAVSKVNSACPVKTDLHAPPLPPLPPFPPLPALPPAPPLPPLPPLPVSQSTVSPILPFCRNTNCNGTAHTYFPTWSKTVGPSLRNFFEYQSRTSAVCGSKEYPRNCGKSVGRQPVGGTPSPSACAIVLNSGEDLNESMNSAPG